MGKKNGNMVLLDSSKKKEYYGYAYGVGTNTMNELIPVSLGDEIDEQNSGKIDVGSVTIKGKPVKYVKWGHDDRLPYVVRNLLGDNMITSQCQLFNMQTTYGAGLRFIDRVTKEESMNEQLENLNLANNFNQVYMEMCQDIVNYYFAVVLLVLDQHDGKERRIVRLVHKEAQNVRFDPKLKYILVGNFEEGYPNGDNEPKQYKLLNLRRPAEDFLMRTGRIPNNEGIVKPEKEGMYAMVVQVPTPGWNYYPRMPFLSIFRDYWYKNYKMIGYAKLAKLRNYAAPRYIIEIQREYWDLLCEQKGVYDEEKRKAVIRQAKKDIENFVCGVQNAGKTWITGAYVDPNGNSISLVKVTNLESNKKEGGDWSDDIQESSNILCFALGVHPNLIGATPGKSAMNNSGSDKRELFILKQTLMTPFRDTLLPPFRLLLKFNMIEGVSVQVPIVQPTTLDKHKDKEETIVGE